MSNSTAEVKKEPKGKFTDLKNFVSDFGVTKYSIYTRDKDGSRSLVVQSITTRGSHTSFISLSELAEIVPLIK